MSVLENIEFTEEKVKKFFQQNPDVYAQYLATDFSDQNAEELHKNYAIVDGKIDGKEVDFLSCSSCSLAYDDSDSQHKSTEEPECKHTIVVLFVGRRHHDIGHWIDRDFTADELVVLGHIPYIRLTIDNSPRQAQRQKEKCQVMKLIRPDQLVIATDLVIGPDDY